jgi:cytochrome P450
MAETRRASAIHAPPPGAPNARALLGHALLDADFLRDPYPTYRVLREIAPLAWSDEFFGGAWLMSRCADVEMALRDTRFSAQRTGGWVMRTEESRTELRGFQRLFARAMIFLDAPDHTRVRQVLAAGFRPSDLQRLTPRIERAVSERLDAVDPSCAFDFVPALARPLPAQVIGMLMGIDEEPCDFVAWSDELAVFIGAPEPTRLQALGAQTALLAMARYFEALLARRRAALDRGADARDDVIDRLLLAERSGAIHGSAELMAQCVMLLFAGHETTRHLLANGLRLLLAHPDAWQRLRCDPALLPGAVRELLRYDCPVQYTGRRVVTDLELHGQSLRRGDLVVALIGAANRDPARHELPDALDITRRPGAPLAFGQGPHACIGAALTLLEAQTVFSQAIERWPDLALVPSNSATWTGNPLYRGVTELLLQPVRRPTGQASSAPTLPPRSTDAHPETACKP